MKHCPLQPFLLHLLILYFGSPFRQLHVMTEEVRRQLVDV